MHLANRCLITTTNCKFYISNCIVDLLMISIKSRIQPEHSVDIIKDYFWKKNGDWKRRRFIYSAWFLLNSFFPLKATKQSSIYCNTPHSPRPRPSKYEYISLCCTQSLRRKTTTVVDLQRPKEALGTKKKQKQKKKLGFLIEKYNLLSHLALLLILL